jgi:hypothetical protein
VSVGAVSKFGGALALSSSTRRIRHTVVPRHCTTTAHSGGAAVIHSRASVIHTITASVVLPFSFSPKTEDRSRPTGAASPSG